MARYHSSDEIDSGFFESSSPLRAAEVVGNLRRSLEEALSNDDNIILDNSTTVSTTFTTTTTAAAATTGRTADTTSDDVFFTETQQIVLAWTGRIAALISFLGGAYICYWAWKRRSHVYHRIMFGLSIYLLLWSPWMIYGTAAVPSGTPGVWGAFGTTVTCTTQGIFNQIHTAIPSYYVALSGYSWFVVVYGNFEPSKYAWIEKYIHVFVGLWAIGSSAYLASIEAFNPVGTGCWVASSPFGCGDDSGVPCTRGPQNISRVLAVFVGLPAIALLVVPTVVMVGLASFLHCKQTTGLRAPGVVARPPDGITAWMVTKQSMVYVGALYWIYTPALVTVSMEIFGDKKSFAVAWLSNAITLSMGLWYGLVYRYFSTISGGSGIVARRGSKGVDALPGTISNSNIDNNGSSNANANENKYFREKPATRPSFAGSSRAITATGEVIGIPPPGGTKRASSAYGSSSESSQAGGEIPNRRPSQRELEQNDSDTHDHNGESAERRDRSQRTEEPSMELPAFTIFDGTPTDEKSRFSEFIFDADNEDEENDQRTTEYWAHCQNVA